MTIIEHHQFKCQQCDAACSFPVVISRFRPVCVQNVMWTDGDISEPLTPRSHPAVICPTCREVHWIEDLESSNQNDSGWSGHSSLEPVYPTAEDYFRYAGGNQTKDEHELTARIIGWWCANDPRRIDIDDRDLPLTEDALENLRALEPLLPLETDYDHMIAGEVKRELSDFKGALDLIDNYTDTNPEVSDSINMGLAYIIFLAEREDFNVMRFSFKQR